MRAIDRLLRNRPSAGGMSLAGKIRALFSNGEQGWWYDPSNFATLFQDAAGTTPVTAVEQPVGLQLDLSKGLVLGPELVTNGDFSGGTTGWTAGSGGAISADTTIFASGIKVTGGGAETTAGAQQVISGFVVGKSYRVSTSAYAASGNSTPNSATISLKAAPLATDSSSSAQVSAIGVIQTLSFVFTATATSHTIYGFVLNRDIAWGNSSSFAYFDNISVKELPGNHRFQSTSANRPVVSARVNLLTKTEQFDDAAWTKNNINSTTGKVTPTIATGFHNTTQPVTYVATGYTAVIEAKADGYQYLQLLSIAGANYVEGVFNLSGEGAVENTSRNSTWTGTRSIVALGDGYYRCTVTVTTASAASGSCQIGVFPTNNPDAQFAGDGTSGILVRKADLRPTNQGVNLPAYQRVNTSTDYDSTGFPTYIKPNGSNQFMQTNSINFTATDKMTVWQGVRKLRSTAAIVSELSTTAANAGTWNFVVGTDNGALGTIDGYASVSHGTAGLSATQNTQIAAAGLDTAVLAITHDIAGDLSTIRRNTVAGTNATGDKGAGNFGNFPAYFYMRAGTQFPFNGHDYGSIARGAASTAVQITNGETWINQRTKAF